MPASKMASAVSSPNESSEQVSNASSAMNPLGDIGAMSIARDGGFEDDEDINEPDDQASDAGDEPPDPPPFVWTHPKHRYLCALATFFKIFSYLFVLSAHTNLRHFEDQKGNYYFIWEVTCNSEGTCMIVKDAKENNVKPGMTLEAVKLLYIIVGTFDICILIVLLVFWCIYFIRRKVLNLMLKVIYIIIGVFAYIKFTTGWLIVSLIPDITRVFFWGTAENNRMYNHKVYPKALLLRTMSMSLMMFAFVLDILCMFSLIVCTDQRTPGEPSYLMQRQLEQEQIEAEAQYKFDLENDLLDEPVQYANEEISHHNAMIMSTRPEGQTEAESIPPSNMGSSLASLAAKDSRNK